MPATVNAALASQRRSATSGGGANGNDDVALRREMYELNQEIAHSNDSIFDIDSNKLKECLTKANDHIRRVSKPADQKISTATFRTLALKGTEKIKLYTRNASSITPAALAAKLVAEFGKPIAADTINDGVNRLEWARLGASTRGFYKQCSAASVSFMLGAFDPPKQRVKAVRGPRKKHEAGPEQKPDDMATDRQDDSNETSKLTIAMHERVEANANAALTSLVLDHDSFAQTVENMFSISILVGMAKISLDQDDQRGVVVNAVGGQRGGRGQEKTLTQMVLNLNFHIWEQMKAAVPRSACLTPHRAAIRLAHGGDGAPMTNGIRAHAAAAAAAAEVAGPSNAAELEDDDEEEEEEERPRQRRKSKR